MENVRNTKHGLIGIPEGDLIRVIRLEFDKLIEDVDVSVSSSLSRRRSGNRAKAAGNRLRRVLGYVPSGGSAALFRIFQGVPPKGRQANRGHQAQLQRLVGGGERI
jgi:hypothetical protein